MVKNKILIIAPKIPDEADNTYDIRFRGILKILSQQYEIHFVYIQSLFSQSESIRRVERMGVKVLSFRKLQSNPFDNRMSPLQYLAEQNEYEIIYFSTLFSAKFYMPALIESSPRSIIVVDAVKSQYISEQRNAANTRDLIQRMVTLKSSEKTMMKEVPLYDQADIVLVGSDDEKRIILMGIIHEGIRVIPGSGENTDMNTLASIFANSSRRKKGWDRDCIDIVSIQGAGATNRILGNPLDVSCDFMSNARDVFNIERRDGVSPVEQCNHAFRRCKREYILIAMQSAVIAEQSIYSLYRCARCHPSHGLIAPASIPLEDHALTDAGIQDFMTRHYKANMGNWNNTMYAESICMLIRKTLLESIGLLDERFTNIQYAFFDYSLKAFRAGYRTIMDYEACVCYGDNKGNDTQCDIQQEREIILDTWCGMGTGYMEQL